MSIETAFARLLAEVGMLQRVVQRQGVLLNNMFREGTVKSVDFQKALAVVEAHGIESKPVPWVEQAGDVVEWEPLAVGQRVVLVSPSGDLGRAFILRGGFTNDVPQPHDQGAQKRTKIENSVITHSAQELLVDKSGTTFSFTSDGLEIKVGGTTFKFTAEGFIQTGGEQRHNDKNVGSSHEHTEVERGSQLTGPPA